MDDKFIDYYELLQVHPKADADVIKKAYYTLMHKNHPDKGGSEDVTKKINEAYTTLTDTGLRKEYDQNRNIRILQKVQALTKHNQDRDKVKVKKTKTLSVISKSCPVLSSYGVLVADERGNRVLIINSEGEITWEYGRTGYNQPNKLNSPKNAVFCSDSNILITDTGNARVVELNSKKETVWQFGSGLAGYGDVTLNSPSSASKLDNGNYLICDTGNKRIIEVNTQGNIVWQYGDLKDIKMFGKSLLPIVNKNTFFLFHPVFAQRLENGNTLIADNGNRKLTEVTNEKKVVWQFPGKKSTSNFPGANFCNKLDNGNILYTLDKVNEIDTNGNLVWFYSKNIHNIDINWAYKIENNQLLVNITRIVRRGVNQEIMMLDANNKVMWRYYYSQYKHL